MIKNGTNILPFLTTKNLGKPTQVGYDLTAKNMKRVMGGTIKKVFIVKT